MRAHELAVGLGAGHGFEGARHLIDVLAAEERDETVDTLNLGPDVLPAHPLVVAHHGSIVEAMNRGREADHARCVVLKKKQRKHALKKAALTS